STSSTSCGATRTRCASRTASDSRSAWASTTRGGIAADRAVPLLLVEPSDWRRENDRGLSRAAQPECLADAEPRVGEEREQDAVGRCFLEVPAQGSALD